MYNNPFMFNPYANAANIARPAVARGLLSGIKSINWSGILSNTQKTLGIINQTIPIVYQVKPMLNNAKTMFKIASTIKDDGSKNKTISAPVTANEKKINNPYSEDVNKPMFFI